MKTIGLLSRKPGSASLAWRRASVSVSPMRTSASVLMPATTMPTSPASSVSTTRGCGSITCSACTSRSVPLAIMRRRWPRVELPVHHAHQHDHADVGVEPRIEDQRARRRARDRPRGGGTTSTIALEQRRDADPLLGRDRQHVGGVEPDAPPRSPAPPCPDPPTGRSILLTTGMISRPASTAR